VEIIFRWDLLGLVIYVLGEVQESHVAMIQSWFHLVPSRNVSHKLDLIGQREDMHIGSHIDVQHVEFVRLAEIVCNVDKTGGSCLWNAVVQHHQVLLEVEVIGG